MASMIDSLKGAVGKVSKKEKEEGILNARLDRYRQTATSARKEYDWKWFQYDLFVNGNHNAHYDKSTQQIIPASKAETTTLLTINKTYSTLRGVRSFVLQHRPKAEVTPYNMTPENVDQAVELNQLLDYIHDRLGFKQKLRASMLHALKYSVGFWQVMWDEEEQEVRVEVVDPYDLYWDPSARVPKEARFVILSVRRSIEDLKEDPMYAEAPWSEIQADGKLSSSSFKSRLMQFERGSQQGQDENEGTVIVDEYWYKESYSEKQEDGTSKNGHKIMLCTRIGDTMIRKPFDTGLRRFPFFKLSSDIEPLSLYGTGWVKNLMPVNKALNILESSALKYNIVVNKAQLMAPKGAGIRYLTNQHGDVVEYKKGFEPKERPIPVLSAIISQQIVNMNRYIEDIGSLHDASMGRQSSSDQSGRSIEALQEGDSNNLSELTENTEEFMEDVYEYILELMSQKYQYIRNVATTSNTGERLFMKFLGEDASQGMEQEGMEVPPGVTTVPSKNIVDVKIASYLAYSSEGRRQAMKDLVGFPQMANLPPDVILQTYQIGPIADIVKKIREEQAKQAQMEAQMAQQQAEAQGQVQMKQNEQQAQIQASQADAEAQRAEAQTRKGEAGMQEAIAFIRAILNGEMPELPKQIGADFIKYLDHFMESPEAQENGTLLSVLQQARDQAQLRSRENPATVN